MLPRQSPVPSRLSERSPCDMKTYIKNAVQLFRLFDFVLDIAHDLESTYLRDTWLGIVKIFNIFIFLGRWNIRNNCDRSSPFETKIWFKNLLRWILSQLNLWFFLRRTTSSDGTQGVMKNWATKVCSQQIMEA